MVINADGTLTYTPSAGYTGTDSFTYTASDGQGGASIATVTVSVGAPNPNAPVVVSPLAAAPGTDGQPITPIDVGSHITDPNSDPLTFTATGLPAGLTISPAGLISGTLSPNASADGPFTVIVTAVDPAGNQVVTTLVITAANPAPTAHDDIAGTALNQPVVIGVLANDVDPDHDALSVTATATPAHGTATINGNGTVTYTPSAGYVGTDTFQYTLTDANGATSIATVTVNIGVPGPLSATPAIAPVTGADGQPITPVPVLAAFGDLDQSAPLTLTVDTTALPPGITFVNGQFVGTPANTASQGATPGQPAGTYVVPVTATDSLGATSTTYVAFSFANLAPVAVNDVATSPENAVVGGNALTNDHDTAPDTDMLHVVAINGSPALVGQPVAGSTGGTFVVKPDGTWTFGRGHAFDNLAVSQSRDTVVSYLVADGQGGTATATITVHVTGQNDEPVALGPIAPVNAVDAAPVAPIDTTVAFSNPNHLVLAYTASDLPAGLSINPAGLITGTPVHDASVQGPYVVTVTATDPSGATSTTALEIAVANPAPVAVADHATTPVNTPVTIAPLANDTDPDHDALSVTSITPPAHGVATLNPDGTIAYVPNTGFVGTETLSYTITDAQGGTSTASITIVVGAPPASAPVLTGTPTVVPGTDGSPITPIDVGSFITDPNHQPLAFTAAGLPTGLVIDPVTGIISGTPANDASLHGPYPIVVTATDPDGNQVTTTVLLAIANPAPLAANDATVTPVNTPVVISVLANDTDPDHDALGVTYVSAPAHGTVVINPDGTLTFTPNEDYTGPDSFSYTVSDGQGGTSIATVTVSVGAPNLVSPVATSPVVASPGIDGSPITPINVGSHVTDPNGDPLTFTATGLPPGLAISPAGIITGTLGPNASADGPFTVTVTAVDPAGNQVVTMLVITATNPAPTAHDDTATTASGQPVVIGVTANDTDPDHDAVTVTSVAAPAHGTATINPNGTVTYTPAAGFTGTDTFQYTITDANGATSIATVTVDVGAPGPLSANPAIAPILGNDGATITPVPVAAAFGDPDQTGPLTLSVDTTTLPPGITFVGGAFVGTPANNASQGATPGQPAGTYVVPVTATDSNGATTTTYVTFTFTNLPPVAVVDKPTVSEDGPALNGDVLANDHDTAPDSDPLSVTAATQGSNIITLGTPFTVVGGGTLTLNLNGLYTFNPGNAYNSLPEGATATETIDYSISDGNGGTASAKLIITINGENDVPVIVDPITGLPIASGQPVIAPQSGIDAQPVTPINTARFFKDPDTGDTLTYAVTNLPTGLHFDTTTGLISGVLDRHASVGGPYTVMVTATDNHNGSSTATFVWKITNPVPAAVGESARTTAGVVLHNAVAGNDFDPDNDGIHYQVATGPSHGTLVLNPDGSYAYNAASGFSGEDSFTYAVVDADGGVSYATCKITVDPALNIVQQVGVGSGEFGGHAQRPADASFRLAPDSVHEYVHPVASEEILDSLPAGSSEHIRLVVEGRTQQLDQQYGAAQHDVPLHWNLGLGREGGQGGGSVYEPLGDTPFWHGLNPLDFSELAARTADVGMPTDDLVVDANGFDTGVAASFSERMAMVRGRFDREALRLMADLEDAA